MQRQVAADPSPSTPGVITTIAQGFSMALWRPLIIIIPVLLDLYYWIGWRVEIGSFAVQLQNWLGRAGVNRADASTLHLAQISQWDVTSAATILFVPSLLSDVSPARIYEYRSRPAYSALRWEVDALIIVGLFIVTMAVSALYLGLLGDIALERRPAARQRLRESARIFARLSGATILALAIVALVSGSLFVYRVHAGEDTEPAFTVALFVQFFVSIGLNFVPDAIVMTGANVFEAFKLSLMMFRRHFWSSMGLIIASQFFAYAMHDLFLRIASNAPGLIIGVVLNAIFSSGLALASFWFFANRNPRSRSAASSSPARSTQSKEK